MDLIIKEDKNIFLIKNPSSSLLPAQKFGDTVHYTSHLIKQEDIETECEDNIDSSSDSCEQSTSQVLKEISSSKKNEYQNFDNLQNVLNKCHIKDLQHQKLSSEMPMINALSVKPNDCNNLQNIFINSYSDASSHTLEDASNNHNIRIKEEPEDSGYDKHIVGLTCNNSQNYFINSHSDASYTLEDASNNHNIRIKKEPEDSGYDNVGLNKSSPNKSLNQVSNALMQIGIKNVSDNNSLVQNLSSSTVEHHTSDEKRSLLFISNEPTIKITKQLLSAVTSGEKCVHDVENSSCTSIIFNTDEKSNENTLSKSSDNIPLVNIKIESESSSVCDDKCLMEISDLDNNISEKHESVCISKSVSNTFNSEMDIFGTDLFLDEENAFSSNYAKYLYLNFDYDKKNIKECLKYFRSKYHSTSVTHELFQSDLSKSCPSDFHENLSNKSIKNFSFQESLLETDKIISTQEVNSVISPTSCTKNHIICESTIETSNITTQGVPVPLASSISMQQLHSDPKIPSIEINTKVPVIQEISSNEPILSTKLSVQKPEIEANKIIPFPQEVNSISTGNIAEQPTHTVPKLCGIGSASILSNEDFYNYQKSILFVRSQIRNELVENTSPPINCIENICNGYSYTKSFNIEKAKKNQESQKTISKTFETPVQYSEQPFLLNANVLNKRGNIQNQMENYIAVNRNLPNLQVHHNETINQNRDFVLNQPLSAAAHCNNLVTKKTNNDERKIEFEPPYKRIKLTNKNCLPISNDVQTVDSTNNLNAACLKPPVSVAANLLQSAKNPKKITSEEYIQRNAALSRDPRLRKIYIAKAASVFTPLDATHLSIPSLTTQVQTIDNSSTLNNLKSSVLNNPRKRNSIPSYVDLPLESSYHEMKLLNHYPTQLIPRLPKPVTGKSSAKMKAIVPTCDLFFHIIGWKTKWLYEKYKTNWDPKCIEKCKKVKNNYQSFAEYQDTYHSLHLFIIWLNIYESWIKNPPSYKAELKEYEEKSHYYKNTCVALMPSADILTHQSIICITCTNAKNECQCLFGYVCEVKTRSTDMILQIEASCKQVLFSFYTGKKLDVIVSGTVEFHKLLKVRVAINQYNALCSFESHPMRDVILNPIQYTSKIQLCSLDLTSYHTMQTDINKIIEISSTNKFTLVLKGSSKRTLLPIIKLVRGFFVKHRAILVCLYNIQMLYDFATLLISCECSEIVLGIKVGEVSVPATLQKYTLRSYAAKLSNMSLEKAELEVLKNSKIILTELSSIFLSDRKNVTLGSNLTCIIIDAHLITEAETAVPLSFKPDSVMLIGNPKITNNKFKKIDYNKSLFHRLFEEKMCEKL